jgi:hypothetical protein
MSRRWGIKRAFWPSVCVETFRKRTPFFEKIRKMWSRTEIEMAFMEILKIIQH